MHSLLFKNFCITFILILSINIAWAGQEVLPGKDYQKDVVQLNEELKKLQNGVLLPKGAIFFMITGNCPNGTTDVSSTYSNKFVRINATAGSTGGSDTDSITLTTTELPAHTHTFRIAGDSVGGTTDRAAIGDAAAASSFPTTSSTGSGTAFTVDTVPAFVTMIVCQVN